MTKNTYSPRKQEEVSANMLQSKKGIERPLVCTTSAGFLVHKNRVLLVKHKKLGYWLAPGGHIDPYEQLHEAAEREFWEETGIKVRAIDFLSGTKEYLESEDDSHYFPRPLAINLHWISKENYDKRQKSKNPTKAVSDNAKWKLGCEQHISYVYLVEPIDGVEYRQNVEETDGIAWFGIDELDELETIEDIKQEAHMILSLAKQKDSK